MQTQVGSENIQSLLENFEKLKLLCYWPPPHTLLCMTSPSSSLASSSSSSSSAITGIFSTSCPSSSSITKLNELTAKLKPPIKSPTVRLLRFLYRRLSFLGVRHDLLRSYRRNCDLAQVKFCLSSWPVQIQRRQYYSTTHTLMRCLANTPQEWRYHTSIKDLGWKTIGMNSKRMSWPSKYFGINNLTQHNTHYPTNSKVHAPRPILFHSLQE